MKDVINEDGIKIGKLEGNIVISEGVKKYRIEEEGKVWALMIFEEELIQLQQGQYIAVGFFKDGKCTDDNGKTIFEIV